MKIFHGRKVLISIGGGIAAYKVCQVVSSIAKLGADVRVIMTQSAEKFVTPLTFAALSRSCTYTDADFWQSTHSRPLHIELGEWADVMLIAPLTANTLAKLVHGLADNLLTNTIMASTCPVLVAPAMNTDMWEQHSVQCNLRKAVQNSRYQVAHPNAGILACDRVGTGRMAEPEELLLQLQSLLHTEGQRCLSGKRILINAGGTREFLDPVRFIGNPSTGKMGVALAQSALHRGASVTLVHGTIVNEDKVGLYSARLIETITSEQMHQTMITEATQADIVVFCAAVADVKPINHVNYKLPKSKLPNNLSLKPVPDIATDLTSRKQTHQQFIGFAAQTGDIVTPALKKLRKKGLDMIVANPVDLPQSGFGTSTNQAVIITRAGQQHSIPLCSKLEMSHHIWDFVSQS